MTSPMEFAIILVTPEMARAWLDESAPLEELEIDGAVRRNRSVNRGDVDKIRRDIAEGRWVLIHQAIAFAEDGCLLDGKTRLAAIADGYKSVNVVIARNVSNEARKVMDTGRMRRQSQILEMFYKIDHGNRIQAMLRLLERCFTGWSQKRTAREMATLHAWCLPEFRWVEEAFATHSRLTSCAPFRVAWAMAHATKPDITEKALAQFRDVYDCKPAADVPENSPIRALAKRVHANGLRNDESGRLDMIVLVLSILRSVFKGEDRSRAIADVDAKTRAHLFDFFKKKWIATYGPWPL